MQSSGKNPDLVSFSIPFSKDIKPEDLWFELFQI